MKHLIVLLYRIKLPLSIIPNLTIKCQTKTPSTNRNLSADGAPATMYAISANKKKQKTKPYLTRDLLISESDLLLSELGMVL